MGRSEVLEDIFHVLVSRNCVRHGPQSALVLHARASFEVTDSVGGAHDVKTKLTGLDELHVGANRWTVKVQLLLSGHDGMVVHAVRVGFSVDMRQLISLRKVCLVNRGHTALEILFIGVN